MKNLLSLTFQNYYFYDFWKKKVIWMRHLSCLILIAFLNWQKSQQKTLIKLKWQFTQ